MTIQSWAPRCSRGLATVKAAYKRRGAVLHSVWVDPGDDSVHLKFDIKPMTEKATEATAAELLELARDLAALSQGDRLDFIGRLVETVPGPWSAGSPGDRPPLR